MHLTVRCLRRRYIQRFTDLWRDFGPFLAQSCRSICEYLRSDFVAGYPVRSEVAKPLSQSAPCGKHDRVCVVYHRERQDCAAGLCAAIVKIADLDHLGLADDRPDVG